MLKIVSKFCKKPKTSLAMAVSVVAVGVPVLKPVPTGCSILLMVSSRVRYCQLSTYHRTLVKLVHAYGFTTGPGVPGLQTNLPFSSRKPFKDEHPGPPLNQIVKVLTGGPV